MDDADPGNIILKLVLLFILTLLNAFFAMSEIAIISLNDAKIDKMAEEGHKRARQVKKLTANSSNFLSTFQNCHPFYTGQQKAAQARGRIDKFNRKYGMNK